jgi:hypothetical protein
MLYRGYRVSFPGGKTLFVSTFEMPDGKLEQYMVRSGN